MGMILEARHDLHWSQREVARDERVEAEITMPGRRTSLVRVFAWVEEDEG